MAFDMQQHTTEQKPQQHTTEQNHKACACLVASCTHVTCAEVLSHTAICIPVCVTSRNLTRCIALLHHCRHNTRFSRDDDDEEDYYYSQSREQQWQNELRQRREQERTQRRREKVPPPHHVTSLVDACGPFNVALSCYFQPRNQMKGHRNE